MLAAVCSVLAARNNEAEIISVIDLASKTEVKLGTTRLGDAIQFVANAEVLGYDVRAAMVFYGKPGTPSLRANDCEQLWAQHGATLLDHRRKNEPYINAGGVEVLVWDQDGGTFTLTVSQEALEDYAARNGLAGDTMTTFNAAFSAVIEVADKLHALFGKPRKVLVKTKDLNGERQPIRRVGATSPSSIR